MISKSEPTYVSYLENEVDVNGRIYGKSSSKTGIFIAFAADYTIVVIETRYGAIVRIPIEDVRIIERSNDNRESYDRKNNG